MKRTYIILIICVLSLTFRVNTNAQTCILDMSDQFGEPICNLHCWARATKNVLYYYGYTGLYNEAIIDYARTQDFLIGYDGCKDPYCATCWLDADTCCKAIDYTNIPDLLEHFRNISSFFSSYKTATFLYEQFIINKPAVIQTSGHTFVAYGVSGSSVYVLDGGGSAIRDINDICPGRTWWYTQVMNNNDNCSYTNNISNGLLDGKTFTASHTLTVSNSTISHDGETTTLRAENNIQLCSGFTLRKGSALILQTGYNFCP